MSKSASPVIDYKETEYESQIKLRRQSTRYFDDFLRLKCAPDLLAWKVFPNAKEITESMAAYAAVRKYGDLDLADPKVHVYCVGDGVTPRTGAVFAVRSAWTVDSIDPRMRNKNYEDKILRLRTWAMPVEQMVPFGGDGPGVLVAVHSHAKLDACWHLLEGHSTRVVVSIPCCVPQTNHESPVVEYADWGIWSPHRLVKIWRW